ncbi:5-(carboxyamino)imidazole ribonucleotide synthase [Oceanibaculum nanhaiense]|uniref:5-(carboxyamino)imidazole ribonucleotide synthase n=1 Tax=Oceanibaculum nanhaiense TaxID=1909734 RepID=UPI000A3BF3DD|nr:5-(carboxyamino)imidazole ribonucleotide synthase [Oceanibaculum nanhaiense]MBC7135374.1 5-(carboxyamino)imidazole ribonucleotide synthase [Oceanibaculum nanhaiense]
MAGKDIIAPGATIGMLGGGQLGRMAALAAANLGYKVHVLTPERDSPAAQVCATTTIADYTDRAALEAFATSVDVVTYEFENVPVEAAELLAEKVPVRPGAEALRVAQDRLREKEFAANLGIGTAPFRAVGAADELASALAAIGTPAVLKTRRMGYDGKGQTKILPDTAPDDSWAAIGGQPAILEGFVSFSMEISVIVARGLDGQTLCYPPVENRHVNHILDTTIVPAPIPPALAAEAEEIARKMAEALDLVGLLAVELFVTGDGRVLMNEIAPRPHNSGHWTMDACVTSQFEQQIRAVCGLPLGSVERYGDAEMKNLIGDQANGWLEILRDPAARLHLYGKAEARPGRKMGHVNRIVRK